MLYPLINKNTNKILLFGDVNQISNKDMMISTGTRNVSSIM